LGTEPIHTEEKTLNKTVGSAHHFFYPEFEVSVTDLDLFIPLALYQPYEVGQITLLGPSQERRVIIPIVQPNNYNRNSRTLMGES